MLESPLGMESPGVGREEVEEKKNGRMEQLKAYKQSLMKTYENQNRDILEHRKMLFSRFVFRFVSFLMVLSYIFGYFEFHIAGSLDRLSKQEKEDVLLLLRREAQTVKLANFFTYFPCDLVAF